jgi:hypothetical protein
MAGNVQKTKIVAVTLQRNSATQITAINNGGTDAGSLSNLTFSGPSITTTGSCLSSECTPSVALGCRTTITVAANPVQMLVVGTFADGTVQILLDQRI